MKTDPVSKPDHYQLRLVCKEVKDIITDRIILAIQTNGFPLSAIYEYSNAIKYVLRAPFKGNPIQDFKKAIFCINEVTKKYESL